MSQQNKASRKVQLICENCWTLLDIIRSSTTEQNRGLECPVCKAQLPETGRVALTSIYGPTPPKIRVLMDFLERKYPGKGRALAAYAYATSNRIVKELNKE